MTAILLLAALASAVAAGQGTEPKAKAAEYPAHAAAGQLTIGAENWGHGFSTPHGSFAAEDFLVVEAAMYPAGPESGTIRHSNFTLRLNKGRPLMTVAPQYAIAVLKHSDWQQRPELTASGGIGDGSITLGRRRPTEQFPGDPRTREGGRPPQAPKPGDPDGMERQPPPKLEEQLIAVALPEVELRRPTSGYLFFPFKGKMTKLKSIELLYEGPAGSASLALR